MEKPRKKQYQKKVTLKPGVTFGDLMKVAVKHKPARKKPAAKKPKK